MKVWLGKETQTKLAAEGLSIPMVKGTAEAIQNPLYKALALEVDHSDWICVAMDQLRRTDYRAGSSSSVLAVAAKLGQGIGEFDTYIRNNQEFIPSFGERYRQGETISTAFVESTINQVQAVREKAADAVDLRGAHVLLQSRTKVLNNELEGVFRRWYPQFRAQAA
jgi:hypothetical protein